MGKLWIPENPGIPLPVAMGQHISKTLRDDVTSGKYENEYEKYQSDPVAFGRDVLKEHFTPDVRRMMESVRDNPVTFAQSANGTGKSHAAARVAIWAYKCFEGSQVYTAAAPPETNLRRILWGEIGSIVEKYPSLFAGDQVSLPGLEIKGKAKHFIAGVTIPRALSPEDVQARFSGKHAPYLLFIIDEGDAVPEAVYKGIESCMSGGIVRLLVLFNPRQEAGPVYKKQKSRQGKTVILKAFNHPNVRDGENHVPGAVDRETTVRRINQWSRPLIDGEEIDGTCFEVPRFLVGAVANDLEGNPYPPLKPGWRKVTESSLDTMTLARYPSMGVNQLISGDWIDKAFSRYEMYVAKYGEIPPRGVRPVSGLDVSDEGEDLSVFQPRYGSWVPSPKIWSGVDTTITTDRAIRLWREYQCLWTNVDGTGVGAGVAPGMNRKGCKAYKIMVQSSPDPEHLTEEMKELGDFYSIRDQMLWLLREWLRKDPAASIAPCEILREELTVLTYGKESHLGKIKVMDTKTIKEKIGRSPDRLMALALSFAPQPKDKDTPGEVSVSTYA